MHIILVDKTAVPAFALGGKEHVQVEFIVFALFRNLLDAFRDLVGHHNHPGQGGVGVVLSLPIFLGTLFIRVGPVVDLLLDKLAGVEGTEWCAGQIQIMVGGDGQPCFIAGVGTAVLLHILGIVVVLIVLFKQLLGVLFPCAKVVLIEDDQIPVDGMYPLVAALDGAGGLIHAKIILERAKADDRTALVGALVGQCRSAGDELPALKILVGVQVLLPRTDHGRLKGEHQHPLKVHPLCQLVGGKGLFKPHFAVPQKFRVALGGG